MSNPFRLLTAEEVARISERNVASRTHRISATGQLKPGNTDLVPSRKDLGHSEGKATPPKPSQTAKRKAYHKINTSPTEHEDQAKLIKWWDTIAATQYKVDPLLMWAIPNSSKLSDFGRVWKAAEGLRAGVPDLFLAWPRGGWCGLFIELKRSKGAAKPTADQLAYWRRLRLAGYQTAIVKGFDAARRTIIEYMTPTPA